MCLPWKPKSAGSNIHQFLADYESRQPNLQDGFRSYLSPQPSKRISWFHLESTFSPDKLLFTGRENPQKSTHLQSVLRGPVSFWKFVNYRSLCEIHPHASKISSENSVPAVPICMAARHKALVWSDFKSIFQTTSAITRNHQKRKERKKEKKQDGDLYTERH